jgi:molecular chaperone DnaK (HSP70)
LFYDNDKDTTWGYSVPADKDALKWFKLLLLDTADIPANMLSSSQLRKARNLLSGIKKDPVEVIACFLRKIWNHAIDSICRSVGVDLVQKSRFHVVITLPAIWPPYAQQRMKQAARVSGILDDRSCGETTLRFISEPEAAALATIKDFSKRSTIKVKRPSILGIPEVKANDR